MLASSGAAGARPVDHHDYWRHRRHAEWRYHHWRRASEWRRGGYVGWNDWRRGRIIDYRIHHLRRPPRGYEWREVGGRYVLAAVASGVIADIILNGR